LYTFKQNHARGKEQFGVCVNFGGNCWYVVCSELEHCTM